MYRVTTLFADLEDNKHLYHAGDEYPRKGYKPNIERIEFLLSNRNLLGTPVIEQVNAAKKPETKEVAKNAKPAASEPVVAEEKPKKRTRTKK